MIVAKALLLLLCGQAHAWSTHDAITKMALQAYEWGGEPAFEAIENTLADLKGVDGRIYASRAELEKAIQISPDKIQWTWKPVKEGSPSEILAHSNEETDTVGFDQNLNLSPDQKFMGGFTGPSSQGYRHMFYEAWSPLAPLATFHYPFREMGEAPKRAALFFDLARQLKKTGHMFWAYRFLGWGLHYVQDITQPYHANQLGSIKLAAWTKLFTSGFEGFIAETTRIVGNFHIAFEEYAVYLLDPAHGAYLANAFKLPKGDELLKMNLEQKGELAIEEGVRLIARFSNSRSAEIVSTEEQMIGPRLRDPSMNLVESFYDGNRNPKIDFRAIESDPANENSRQAMRRVMFGALSNAGVATRWYVDRFRSAE